MNGEKMHIIHALGRKAPEGRKRYRYLCPTLETGVPQGGPRFDYNVFEAAVLSLLRELRPTDIVPDKAHASGRDAERARLTRRLRDIDSRLERANQRARTAADFDVFLDLIVELQGERKNVGDQLAGMDQEDDSGTPSVNLDAAQSLIGLLEQVPEGEREDLRRRLRGRIQQLVAGMWLLVGDPYQLPPVSHGAPLRDFIRAGVPTGLLTEIKRQDGPDNLIVQGCVSIKDGHAPATTDAPNVAEGRNLWMVRADSGPQAIEELQRIVRALKADLSRAYDPVWDVQVLCPRNAVTPVSRLPLNAMLQAELNPLGRQQEGEPKGFRVGDKIIYLKNSWLPLCSHVDDTDQKLAGRRVPESGPRDEAERYILDGDLEAFVANGEQGKVVAVGPRLAVADLDMPPRRVLIRLGKVQEDDAEKGEDGMELKGTGCDFSLAYAVTIHKSQGSEWPVVIVMLDQDGGPLGVRELIYTAISRASKLCILIGKTFTLAKWARKESLSRRKTFLAELIGEAMK